MWTGAIRMGLESTFGLYPAGKMYIYQLSYNCGLCLCISQIFSWVAFFFDATLSIRFDWKELIFPLYRESLDQPCLACV